VSDEELVSLAAAAAADDDDEDDEADAAMVVDSTVVEEPAVEGLTVDAAEDDAVTEAPLIGGSEELEVLLALTALTAAVVATADADAATDADDGAVTPPLVSELDDAGALTVDIIVEEDSIAVAETGTELVTVAALDAVTAAALVPDDDEVAAPPKVPVNALADTPAAVELMARGPAGDAYSGLSDMEIASMSSASSSASASPSGISSWSYSCIACGGP